MVKKIYVLIDHANGKARPQALESLALGQQLAQEVGGSVHALLLGLEVAPVARQLAGCELASIVTVEDAKLADYDPDASCLALAQILGQDSPQLLLLPHSYQNIDLAPKLAACLKRALVTDCIGYRVEESGLVFVRQMFRGKLNADVAVRSEYPWIITVQAGAVPTDKLRTGTTETEPRTVDLSALVIRRRTMETKEAAKGKVDLSKAAIIIGVGRGLKKKENLPAVFGLAELMGAEVGASRPVVDNEWLERERQVGSSGQTVTPKLYLACGISGAIQHVVGMKNSGCIVAINSDPNAPIFNLAQYGVVGDALEIIAALTRKLAQER
jgi:electron transfer flavoprotein alpha subunit